MSKWTDPEKTGVCYYERGEFIATVSDYGSSIAATIAKRRGFTWDTRLEQWFDPTGRDGGITTAKSWCEKKLSEIPEWAI